jgi:hypothetical protein
MLMGPQFVSTIGWPPLGMYIPRNDPSFDESQGSVATNKCRTSQWVYQHPAKRLFGSLPIVVLFLGTMLRLAAMCRDVGGHSISVSLACSMHLGCECYHLFYGILQW